MHCPRVFFLVNHKTQIQQRKKKNNPRHASSSTVSEGVTFSFTQCPTRVAENVSKLSEKYEDLNHCRCRNDGWGHNNNKLSIDFAECFRTAWNNNRHQQLATLCTTHIVLLPHYFLPGALVNKPQRSHSLESSQSCGGLLNWWLEAILYTPV